MKEGELNHSVSSSTHIIPNMRLQLKLNKSFLKSVLHIRWNESNHPAFKHFLRSNCKSHCILYKKKLGG